MFRILLACALLAASRGARAGLVLNEVLYDPSGPDAGAEFVELWHDGDEPLSLAGCRLVFVNGSDPSRPSVVWEASPNDHIAPGAWFVIGGEAVHPRDVTENLALQNGPDGLQLWRDDVRLDAVAWGEVAGVGEGAPAPDVASTSLGRQPDGADTDDNAADWFALPEPTPGSANLQPSRFELALEGIEPTWRLRPGTMSVQWRAVAIGADPFQRSRLRAWLDDELVLEGELSAARGDTTWPFVSLEVSAGAHRLALRSQAGADSLAVGLFVGLGDVILSEVLARPEAGTSEWVELRSLSAETVDLAGWSIADAGREPRGLPAGAELGALGYAVVAQDCAAIGDPAATPCWELDGGWPTLNNTPSGGEWADEVLLIDPSGAVVDWAPYDDRLQPATGVSMERSVLDGGSSAVWFASPGRPTPGLPNLTAGAAVPAGGLEVSPNPFSPDGDGRDDVLHVVLRESSAHSGASAQILDLGGDAVRNLGESEGGELLQWIWDGCDERGRAVAMGAYVVLVQASARARPWRALVVVGRRS